MLIAQLIPLLTHPGLLLGGAAAVAIPVAIHLLWRLRRQPQPWAAMRFLMQAYQKHRSRLRLEQILLLAVRCLVLLVAGLAMSGPMLTSCSQQTSPGSAGSAGKLGGATGNSGGGGGVIHLVIDDGLSSQTLSEDATARFEKLRAAALSVVAASSADDRVAIWLSARPVEVALPLTMDHAQAVRTLEALTPRYSRSDLSEALSRVATAVTQENLPAELTRVIVLSDLSVGSLPTEKAMPAEWSVLLNKAAFSLLKPAQPSDNTQITSMLLRQPMVVADPLGGTSAAAELKLQRFGSAPAATSKITLWARSQTTGEPAWKDTSKTLSWAAGQTQATLEARFDLTAIAAESSSRSGALVTLGAALDDDQLIADNTRLASVEYRSRLQVGIVRGSETSASTNAINRDTPDPKRWLTLALGPADRANSSIETLDLSASNLTPATLATTDALLIVSPDQLPETAWLTLRQALARGVVVWFFTPPTNQPAIWTTALTDKLNLPWDLSIDPLTPGIPPAPGTPGISSGRPSDTSPTNANTTDEAAWSLTLDDPAPLNLKLLSADWQDLLRPVRIYKRLNVRQPQGSDKPWISLSDATRSPVMVVQKLDQGHVVLLATALDPAWTNLTVKPLFVPLLHETLRSLLAESSSPPQLRQWITGQKIALPTAWRSAEYLSLSPGSPAAPGNSGGSSTSNKATSLPQEEVRLPLSQLATSASPSPDNKDALTRTTAAPRWPGIYRAVPALPGGQAAVNVDAAGGDTRTLDEQPLSKWLTAAGPWQWLDPNNPFATTAAQRSKTNWGWPLLVVAAILLALETLLARWFSHAKLPGSALWQSLWHRLIASRFSPAVTQSTTGGQA
jgi:hypothetical protein